MENKARLAKISGLLREAYQAETQLEPDVVIEGLKVENRALREALGVGEPGLEEVRGEAVE